MCHLEMVPSFPFTAIAQNSPWQHPPAREPRKRGPPKAQEEEDNTEDGGAPAFAMIGTLFYRDLGKELLLR